MYIYKSKQHELDDVDKIYRYSQYIFLRHNSVFGYYPNTFQLEAIIHLFEIHCIHKLGKLAIGLQLLKFESRVKIRRLGVNLIHNAFILDPFESTELSNKFKFDYSPLKYTYKTYYRNPIPIVPHEMDNYDMNIFDPDTVDILNNIIDNYQFDLLIEYHTDRIVSGSIIPYQYYFIDMDDSVRYRIDSILSELDSKYTYVPNYECRNKRGETEIYINGRLSENKNK